MNNIFVILKHYYTGFHYTKILLYFLKLKLFRFLDAVLHHKFKKRLWWDTDCGYKLCLCKLKVYVMKAVVNMYNSSFPVLHFIVICFHIVIAWDLERLPKRTGWCFFIIHVAFLKDKWLLLVYRKFCSNLLQLLYSDLKRN